MMHFSSNSVKFRDIYVCTFYCTIRWQTKPYMTIHGDLYYEGKEFETRLKNKKPGDLSDELRVALGMPTGLVCIDLYKHRLSYYIPYRTNICSHHHGLLPCRDTVPLHPIQI